MKSFTTLVALAALTVSVSAATTTNSLGWLTQPLSLTEALNLALKQNATISKAKNDLEASHGLVVQTRAIALPQLTASGQVEKIDPGYIESVSGFSQQQTRSWNSGIRLVQNVYMGGRMVAAIKAADVTKVQALANYRTAVANALLNVRLAYYDVLLAEQLVTVREASVKLLAKELDDQQKRFDAGTVPHFNVLRAEVAVANEKPALIAARNTLRLAKNTLVNALGYNLPREIWDDIPLNLSDKLTTEPYAVNVSEAIQQALAQRTELTSLRQNIKLQKLNIVDAKSGYKPVIGLFAGYNWHSAQLLDPIEMDHAIQGWNAGAQLSWNIFDGAATFGKVTQAKAKNSKAQTELDDQSRLIELGVRSAYSDFVQARETLESQSKVVELADEALREAKARADAGTGTQLDVLNAETELTKSRTTQVQAQHDYTAARAKLERAIGADLAPLK